MVPIEPELSWQETLRYSEQLAGQLAGAAVDCRYNARSAAAIGAWSPRALPGFPLAAPLDWTQLQRGVRPDTFTLQQHRKGRKRT
jgi:bifunctional non-homologous end joining protein LigD